MLIELSRVMRALADNNTVIKGVLHIGAHECEEAPFYKNMLHIPNDRIIWVDANIKKVAEMRGRGYAVEQAVLDETEHECDFNITDNTQASSLLRLNHENGFYNNINITETQKCNTERLSTFMRRINKDIADYNFWNLDIQGSELNVLRGSEELLTHCDAVYTEINRAEVYTACGLVTELDTLLAKYGFTRVITEWTDMQWGDALYLKVKV
jgi:FkbM family methyltransferase